MKTSTIVAILVVFFFLLCGADIGYSAGNGTPAVPKSIHLEASPAMAPAQTPYSDAVEETREENALRVLGAALVYYFIHTRYMKHRAALRDAKPAPCVQSAPPATLPTATAAPAP